MAYANSNNAMAIATGNKSELGQGYCTLYGDMAGGYAPLGDLYKMEVYELAKIYNQRRGKNVVTESTLTKPPSAELAPDQKDEDSLPPYPVLDEILRLHIESGFDATEIAERGHDEDTVRDVLTRLSRNEHTKDGKCLLLQEFLVVHLDKAGANHYLLNTIGDLRLVSILQ